MDPSQSDHSKQEDASGEDTAIMLFGKQIKSLSSAEKIKEELSPRGVDEKGLSFATSSDDEEDLYPATDFSMQVTPTGSMSASETSKEHARKRKAIESGCVDGLDDDTEEPKSTAGNTTPVMMGGGEHADAEQQLKSGLWSRCPRCSSADTKFCYFNNYNVNQPRHFCKHCQRYWTAGGTLRNVPIGAGKRKNKHTLHKNGFVTNFSSTCSIPTPSLPPLGVSDTHPLPMAKSELLSTSGSSAISVMKTDLVNTNLELSTHNPFTDARTSSLPPCNFIHPHSAHKLVTLQQLQENPQSRLSQAYPHSHECSTNYGQFYPNLDCGHSSLSPINPNLACGQSSLGQGLHNMEATHHLNPSAHNELYKLSQICRHLRGGCPVIPQICHESQSECPRLTQIYPELQRGCADFARPSTQLQSELCNLCRTCPHVPSGSCRTERGLSEVDEVKRIVENGLPTSDQKSTSLERGLPDMVRIASEEPKKVSSLQIRHPKMGPDEEDKCMQWFEEKSTTVCSALVSCKADMKGSCHGLVAMKATPPYLLQHNNAQTSSTSSTLVSKSEEASNVDNLMTRGGEGQNNLLNVWGSLWPCFYNMLWLDPLALSHVNPILTPQGWALPFIQPSVHKVESAYSTYSNTSPTTNISKNLDSTRTHINTPAALVAPFEDICTSTSNVSTGSPRKPVLPPARTSPQPH